MIKDAAKAYNKKVKGLLTFKNIIRPLRVRDSSGKRVTGKVR